MNLEQIIDQWIGEDKEPPHKKEDFEPIEKDVPISEAHIRNTKKILENQVDMEYRFGYNQALQDLKSRKQELMEGIVGLIEDSITGNTGEYPFPTFKQNIAREIIKELTDK